MVKSTAVMHFTNQTDIEGHHLLVWNTPHSYTLLTCIRVSPLIRRLLPNVIPVITDLAMTTEFKLSATLRGHEEDVSFIVV